jgi:hypothetical protein
VNRGIMTQNAFIGKTQAPTEPELLAALGSAKPIWDQLLNQLEREHGANTREWKCYSPKAGWSLRLKRKARTIVWLGPRKDSFLVAFILSDKALQSARATKLPARILRAIATAPRYPEGNGVRFVMKTARDISAAKALAGIKVAN